MSCSYSSPDGISHLNPFICQECGFEFPESHESKYLSVCTDCEKELVEPLATYSLKRMIPINNSSPASYELELPF